ncbi:High-affnity carbon uptake protein Hat/HatR [uncultured Gammaproteobacteria bacterium]|nr:High-affnity carbon uptake protein Hat/HatR [uncultured Gammaproteobacteria bacterium]
MKIKLFYSYSHEDETDRNKLEKHLATLKNNQLIGEWHDRKITAGDNWKKKINDEMNSAHIILLLFSTDFIDSSSCQKEVETALSLKEEKETIFIPIILKKCAWKSVEGMSEIQALPKDARAISLWGNKDEAWSDVYEKIKEKVEYLRSKIKPTLKPGFKDELLKNPIMDCKLDKLFVYPDILESSQSKQKLENNEIDSKKLIDIVNFKYKYILVEGDEQSGKTSLCRMLYLHYVDADLYPVLMNGKDIKGKADINTIINTAYQNQYDSTSEYWLLQKDKRILIIDDINNRSANDKNYSIFLQSIKQNFEYAIVLIDELSNLSNKSTEHNYFYFFNDYSIEPLGHVKRDELIKKCIENDEGAKFDTNNNEQVAKLDKDTQHINNVVGSNILPSYPVFIVSTFNIIESATSHNMHETSYGHCYHAMITMQLYRTNIRPESMDQYFNFLTEFSYFMFSKNQKLVSQKEMDDFIELYKKSYIFDGDSIKNLVNSNSLINKNDEYSFQYIYMHYYFVAKYLADHIEEKEAKNQIDNLISNIHKKDNSNIVVFITHHTKNTYLINSILTNTKANFANFPEATLEKKETMFINEMLKDLDKVTTPSPDHDPEETRRKQLEEQDTLKQTKDKLDNKAENDEDLLLVEIRKSAKSIEIIGQIMRNQYGTFEKDKLGKLFQEGQNTGLRLLKSFIDLMSANESGLNEFVQQRISQISKEKNQTLSPEKIKSISGKLIAEFSYNIIFGWLHKIVESLGYDKLIGVADEINNKTDTITSKLINFSIHAWHAKNIDIEKLKSLHNNFEKNKNYTAIYMLKNIVSRHVYMHKLKFDDKQKIDSLLGFDIKKQLSAQSKIKNQ